MDPLDNNSFTDWSRWKRLPGYNYCGPGNNGKPPINPLDEACQVHDECYSVLSKSGTNPYTHYNVCDANFLRTIENMQGPAASTVRTFFKTKRSLAPTDYDSWRSGRKRTNFWDSPPLNTPATRAKKAKITRMLWRKRRAPFEQESYFKMPFRYKRKRRGRRRYNKRRFNYQIAKAVQPHRKWLYEGYIKSTGTAGYAHWSVLAFGHVAWWENAFSELGYNDEALVTLDNVDIYVGSYSMRISLRNNSTQPCHLTIYKLMMKRQEFRVNTPVSSNTETQLLQSIVDGTDLETRAGTTDWGTITVGSGQDLAYVENRLIGLNAQDSQYFRWSYKVLSQKHYIFPPGAQMRDSFVIKKNKRMTVDLIKNAIHTNSDIPGWTCYYLFKQRGFEGIDDDGGEVVNAASEIIGTKIATVNLRQMGTLRPITAVQNDKGIISGNVEGPQDMVIGDEAH